MEQQPIEVFFSYSREDKSLRDKLEIHLSSLKRQGVISSWHDRQIVAGSEWEEEIDRHMRTADIILLLVSPNFVASKYCYEIELPEAMARHEAEDAYVVPILLRPVAGWKLLPFAKLQLYPSGGVPITQWSDQDTAFVDVAEGIAIAVKQLLEQRRKREWLRLEQARQEREEQGELKTEKPQQENKKLRLRDALQKQNLTLDQVRQLAQQSRLTTEKLGQEHEELPRQKQHKLPEPDKTRFSALSLLALTSALALAPSAIAIAPVVLKGLARQGQYKPPELGNTNLFEPSLIPLGLLVVLVVLLLSSALVLVVVQLGISG